MLSEAKERAFVNDILVREAVSLYVCCAWPIWKEAETEMRSFSADACPVGFCSGQAPERGEVQ